jgi:hypothetical protein
MARRQVPPAPQRYSLRRGFRLTWLAVRDRVRSIEDTRFIVLLLALGALLVLWAPQGKDVIATLSDTWSTDSSSMAQWWCFLLAVIFLGLQAWMWSRLLIQLRHAHIPSWRNDKLLVHLPRILGVAPYAVAGLALAMVDNASHRVIQVAILLLCGALAYFFYWKRLALVSKLASWKHARTFFQDHRLGLPLSAFEFGVLGFSLLLAAVSLIWFAFDPVTVPRAVGSAAIAFLAFGLVIPGVSVLMALVWQERFPVLTVLGLLAVLTSVVSDNHIVRALPAKNADRDTLEVSFGKWLAQAPRASDDENVVPIVFVSVAGGASRAALWSLASLQHLDAIAPDLHRSIFAISAVSGGALGTADYIAGRTSGLEPAPQREVSWTHVGSDFLAPAIAGLLYTDLFQRFLPYPIFQDRSWSIERGFEAEWDASCERAHALTSCKGRFANSFLDLWPKGGEDWVPNALLVGTVQEDGRRIVTSNVDLMESIPTSNKPWYRPWLPDAYDYYHAIGRPIAVSTAVMNSARFPVVSPSGGFIDTHGVRRGHVIDGGYFESSATDTSVDLASAIEVIAHRRCPSQDCPRLRPIFLTLLNSEIVDQPPPKGPVDPCDPERGRVFEEGRIVPTDRLEPKQSRRPIANDLLGPVRGMLATQGGRAELTLARLVRSDGSDERVPAQCRASEPAGAASVVSPVTAMPREIRLMPCRVPSDRPLAMSWALSEPTRKRIIAQLDRLRFAPDPGPRPVDWTDCGWAQQQEVSRLAEALQNPASAAMGF